MAGETPEQKTIKVLMVCAMGMSSSLLEAKTKEAANKAGVPFELKAVAVNEINVWDPKARWYDIVLVAPQVFYKRKAIQLVAERYGILVQPIEATVFGMVDGDALFKQIMAAIKARDEAKEKEKEKEKEKDQAKDQAKDKDQTKDKDQAKDKDKDKK